MLAKSSSGLPVGDNLVFEPKWDGFRCIVFRDGDDIELGSRNERPLTRYFPELIEACRNNLPERCVIDGEIIVSNEQGLDFDALQQRIHPAASRVNRLAEETPAEFVAFDLLACGNENLMGEAFATRRMRLQKVLAQAQAPIRLTPATTDRDVAERWFTEFEGAGLDGLIAKSTGLRYQPDKRVMVKIKHERTADCVVAGFRWHKSGPIVGSLLLGAYDDSGNLHNLGITASFTMARRKQLIDEIEPFRVQPGESHPWQAWAESTGQAGARLPGAPSRWNAKKDLSFEPLRPELVVEVAYDHLQGDRFRHATTFKRWRPERVPTSCTLGQFETVAAHSLEGIFTHE